MGYATRYSLKLTNLMDSEEYRATNLDNLISDVKYEKLSKEELVSKLQMIQRGVETVDADYIMDQLIETNESAAYAIDRDGETVEECKWYEHKKDLISFSKKYPTWLFTLQGIGEESPDLWRLYVLNGKSQFEKAKITYEDFDSRKLV